jgi:hypothetical protein
MSDCLSRIRAPFKDARPAFAQRHANGERASDSCYGRVTGVRVRTFPVDSRDETFRQVRHGAKTLRGTYK